MANDHVEIHDPLSDCNNLTTSSNCDPKSTSATGSMGDTVEFRMLMVYAQRRRPSRSTYSTLDSTHAQNGDTNPTEPLPSPQKPPKTKKEKKSRKLKGRKGLSKILTCIKPQIKDDESPSPTNALSEVSFRCGLVEDVINKEDSNLEDVVSRLTEIADEIPFTPPKIESDSPDDDVEKVIALLLREAGDRLNEEELKKAGIAKELFWNYSFFERLMQTFLMRMGLIASEPNALGPQASPKTQIAVACEITTRLTALNTLPMSRMLDHGARYLQLHHSTWAQQHGGYEEAFYSDNEDDTK